MLIVDNVSKIVKKRKYVDGVSLQAKSPGIAGIVGPWGSGKSTLLKIICGIEDGTGGTVVYNDQPLTSMKHKRPLFFFMPEEYRIYPDYRVSEYMDFINTISGAGREELAASLGIVDYISVMVEKLSASQLQHLKLYAALSNEREIIIIDEPFIGLDPSQINNAVEIMSAEKAAGKTLLVAMQDLGNAVKLCDTLALMREGRILAQGTLAELAEEHEVYDGNLEDIFIKALAR